MPIENSKPFQLSSRDIKSTSTYIAIIAVAQFIPLIPEAQSYLISLWLSPIIAGYFMSVMWILLKKFLSDYSK